MRCSFGRVEGWYQAYTLCGHGTRLARHLTDQGRGRRGAARRGAKKAAVTTFAIIVCIVWHRHPQAARPPARANQPIQQPSPEAPSAPEQRRASRRPIPAIIRNLPITTSATARADCTPLRAPRRGRPMPADVRRVAARLAAGGRGAPCLWWPRRAPRGDSPPPGSCAGCRRPAQGRPDARRWAGARPAAPERRRGPGGGASHRAVGPHRAPPAGGPPGREAGRIGRHRGCVCERGQARRGRTARRGGGGGAGVGMACGRRAKPAEAAPIDLICMREGELGGFQARPGLRAHLRCLGTNVAPAARRAGRHPRVDKRGKPARDGHAEARRSEAELGSAG